MILKISVITVCYNSSETIKEAIESVINQTYNNIEYIVVDGLSTDGTQDIIKSYGDKISKFVSEKDKGLYDAMNKGIKLATGDVVGILNSDDFFKDKNVLKTIADAFVKGKTDSVYGDVVIVDPQKKNRIIRYYSSKNFKVNDFNRGIMPPHPSVFIKRHLFEKYGYYDLDFKICADFDFLLRLFFIHKINIQYLPLVTTIMKSGGLSNQSLFTKYTIYQEMKRSIIKNGLEFSIFKYLSKYYSKFYQFIDRPKLINDNCINL